ncbi:MAG TPA: protein kinase [Gemmatimonadaceae bacterium]|nr:protein kinase [Gemmatimonadaceae bacterium]
MSQVATDVLRLTTLGGLALLEDGRAHAGPASQRRRLALLTLVAAAGRRGISRDKLVANLWPDAESEAGRHSLHQAMHALRRALGSDELFVGTAALQLNPAVLTSDVAEFEEAVERGSHEQAARLYGGPFLDGFRLGAGEGSDVFERWQEGERARRAREYAGALEALAGAAAARGDHVAAAQWWRRLATAEPLSTRAALGLVEALVASGDRAGALHFATLHASLVRQELDAEPDAAVERWIARLRSGAPVAPTAAGAAAAPPPSAGRSAPAAAPGAGEADELTRALGARYRIGAKSGESTMVVTYAAHDRRDARPVELHVLRARLGAPAARSRVLGVLERLGALSDPRVAAPRDCGAAGDVVYFATDPVEDGETLRDRLTRERQLPVADAVAIAADVAGALAYAHERGVRHGDLRPKHLRLTRAGVVVSNFGVLDALDGAITGPEAATTAVTIGAPAYLSPEQLAGEVVADERSDLYSLGCILYEMLAGEPPFGGGSQSLLVSRKLTRPAPSILDARDSVPDELDRAIARTLARLPADRFRTAREMEEALSRGLLGGTAARGTATRA